MSMPISCWLMPMSPLSCMSIECMSSPMVFIVAISAFWAEMMSSASERICAWAAFSWASSAMSMAPSWWALISAMNAASVLLPDALVDELSSSPQLAMTATSRTSAATSASHIVLVCI